MTVVYWKLAYILYPSYDPVIQRSTMAVRSKRNTKVPNKYKESAVQINQSISAEKKAVTSKYCIDLYPSLYATLKFVQSRYSYIYYKITASVHIV